MSAHEKEKGEKIWTALSCATEQMVRQANELVNELTPPHKFHRADKSLSSATV